jgi:hypothetical protein
VGRTQEYIEERLSAVQRIVASASSQADRDDQRGLHRDEQSLSMISSEHIEGWLASRSSRTNAGERRSVDQTSASWNRIASWLARVEALRAA